MQSHTEKPEWIIWLIWAIVGQYTDKMTQKYVKNEFFCPCSDPLWLKWVKWLVWVFLCSDVIIMAELKIADFEWNIDQNWQFRLKSSKYRKFTGVLAYYAYTISFKTIQSINFSKWRLLIFSGGNHPPVSAIFDGLPYPPPPPIE